MLSDDYDGFFEVYKKKKVQKDFFVTCLGLQKTNIYLVNIPRRNYMKTKEELEEAIKDTTKGYKEIIFGSDVPVCISFLDELRKQ